MDRKRELTSVDVAAVAGELGRYAGAGVDKAYLYPADDLLRLKLRHHDHGRIELLCEVGEQKRAHVVDQRNVPDAPERPPDFAMMLRNRLEGAHLAAVEQFEFDRILTFTFERDTDETRVVVELFGDGNVAVLDEHGDVVDCLETVRLKSRTVTPGARYEYPEARFDPLGVDYETFAARMRQSDADVVRTLATQCNFGGLYGEELCTRAGVPYNQPIEETDDDELQALHGAVEDLARRLREGDLDARVYYEPPGRGDGDGGDDGGDGDGGDGEPGEEGGDRDDPVDEATTGHDDNASASPDAVPEGARRLDATPVALQEYGDQANARFETFNAALEDYFVNVEREDGSSGGQSGRGDDGPGIDEEIATQERIVEQQEGAIEDFAEQADAEREKAESLYARYDLVDDILSTVQAARAEGHGWEEIGERFAEGEERGIDAATAVESVDGSEGTVTVTLDDQRITLEAAHGVEKNADRLYEEAKRIERKREGAEEALAESRAELERLREEQKRREQGASGDGTDESASESVPGEGSGEAGAEENETGGGDGTDWLARESIPVRQSEQWYERFRWFHTSDGYLVIGGRDADQNEALVSKYLEPGDEFYHAQAHGGPVTILKATGPSEPSEDVDFPEASREEAATFAVAYSSVWKDGRYAGDAYCVDPDQVSKTPESGEYLEKGGFAIRGDREYFEDVAADVSVGITCVDETRVIGGPTSAIEPRAETTVRLEPGQFAQNDAAKKVYRVLKDRFADESFVRKVASPDLIQKFLPPGGSRIVD